MTTLLRCGQILNFVAPNQYGANAYLWTTGLAPELSTDQIVTAQADSSTSISYTTKYAPMTFTGTTFNMYDASTGKYILSIVNGTSMTALTTDESGSLIGYYVNASTANAYNAPTLNCWNSTQAIMYPAGKPEGANYWEWRPAQNVVIPFDKGLMWSKPLATNISGAALPSNLGIQISYVGSGGILAGIDSGVILMTSVDPNNNRFYPGYLIEAGYSITTGQQLWIANRTETPFSRLLIKRADSGIYLEVSYATAQAVGYSITTGEKLWTTQLTGENGGAPNAYNSIGDYFAQSANGVDYINGFGGDIWAVNVTNGNVIWYTNTNKLSGDAGTDTPYGTWPIWSFGNPAAVADGMLFLAEGHEYSPPLFRGAHQLAVNITNGQLVWGFQAFNVNGGNAIADGIMVAPNAYDNQIYAFGVGPSNNSQRTKRRHNNFNPNNHNRNCNRHIIGIDTTGK